MMRIVIDTREQTPYSFPSPTIVRGLVTGDYSLEGHEHKVCIERKTIADLFHTLGDGAARFKAELQRMKAMQRAVIVIEGCAHDVLAGPQYYHSKKLPKSAYASITLGKVFGIVARNGVPVLFCMDRGTAERATRRILKEWTRMLRGKRE